MPVTHVAVLGGGLLGCCTAIALAERGARVTIYEQDDQLIGRASRNNEGKVHLGYVYAGDLSLATARMMIRGGLSFGPFFERHLGLYLEDLNPSSPVVYPVHKDTQRSVEGIAHHLAAVHLLLEEAASGRPRAYLGRDTREPPRRWTPAELESDFNPDIVPAVFDTHELAVDPFVLAARVRERVAAESRIEVRLNRKVIAVEDDGAGLIVTNAGNDVTTRDPYDAVVNALWDGRVLIDAARGMTSRGPWLHRFRYGARLEPNGVAMPRLPSATVVHGPFGGVVRYDNGAIYVNWYPACLRAVSAELTPPDLPTEAAEPLRSTIIMDTFRVLGGLMPALSDVEADFHARASVVGGVIFAIGSSDIDDPSSGLHHRDQIGIVSSGRYHSVDPGKLTLVPYFAEMCANRILPRE